MGGAGILALAEHEAAHQAGDAGVDMHHRAAGEVEYLVPAGEVALLVGIGDAEDTVWPPHPVRDRRVDEDRPQADEPQHRRELHALGESPSDQRRRDDREGQLEAEVDALGDRRREWIRIADALRYVADNVLQEDTVEAPYVGGPFAERQAVGADQP